MERVFQQIGQPSASRSSAGSGHAVNPAELGGNSGRIESGGNRRVAGDQDIIAEASLRRKYKVRGCQRARRRSRRCQRHRDRKAIDRVMDAGQFPGIAILDEGRAAGIARGKRRFLGSVLPRQSCRKGNRYPGARVKIELTTLSPQRCIAVARSPIPPARIPLVKTSLPRWVPRPMTTVSLPTSSDFV